MYFEQVKTHLLFDHISHVLCIVILRPINRPRPLHNRGLSRPRALRRLRRTALRAHHPQLRHRRLLILLIPPNRITFLRQTRRIRLRFLRHRSDACAVEFVVALLLLLLALLELLDGVLGELLAEHALDHVLLAREPVADGDGDAGGDVAADGAAEDDGGERERPDVVADGPGAGAERDLQ